MAGSAGSLAISALSRIAASRTVRVIGPAVSWLWLIGTMRVRGIRPSVGLRPTSPVMDEGQMIEPLVSLPMAPGARRAATAAPDPLDEPQVVRSSA